MLNTSFLALLEMIENETDQQLQISTLRSFIFVAIRGECTQKDVEMYLGSTNAATSRNISYFTHRRFDRRPGLGWLERVEDDYDRRLRRLSLTAKGKRFWDKVQQRIGSRDA